MKDYLDVSSTPFDEPCAQVGTANYQRWAKIECLTLIDQIRRLLGPEPEQTRLTIKANPHDFGTYYEVVVHYDDDYPASEAYAFDCEAGEQGSEWDDVSIAALQKAGYHLENQ